MRCPTLWYFLYLPHQEPYMPNTICLAVVKWQGSWLTPEEQHCSLTHGLNQGFCVDHGKQLCPPYSDSFCGLGEVLCVIWRSSQARSSFRKFHLINTCAKCGRIEQPVFLPGTKASDCWKLNAAVDEYVGLYENTNNSRGLYNVDNKDGGSNSRTKPCTKFFRYCWQMSEKWTIW